MNFYTAYLNEITKRKKTGLKPEPIADGNLALEIISQIKDNKHEERENSLRFFI